MRYTVDVTAGLAFGTDINTIESQESEIREHLDKLMPGFAKRLFAPFQYWHWFKRPADRTLDRHLEAIGDVIDGFIASTRQRLKEQPELRERPTNMIEAMVTERDRAGSALSDEDVSGNVLTMLLAGEDTTANTLAWMIWLLHRNPAALKRAAEEVCGAGAGGQYPSAQEQLRQLDYVEACAHEAMRLRPVAPINAQQAVRDATIGDVMVPAGTIVMCLTRPPGLDPARFSDPLDFKPERWLGAGGPSSASSAKRATMPFGAGPRMWPGRYLAMHEIKILIAMLLGTFQIADVSAPAGDEVKERLAITMFPVGLAMRLRLRDMPTN